MISINKKIVRSESDDSVIVKVGNVWRIKGNKVKYWNAKYKTKKDAQAALRAYWANKRECYNHSVTEGFNTSLGTKLVQEVQSFLISIFGPTVYFDHFTDNYADLHYQGDTKAELFYDDRKEKIFILPKDKRFSPVELYDTSIYEIKKYLSDLLLGDIEDLQVA